MAAVSPTFRSSLYLVQDIYSISLIEEFRFVGDRADNNLVDLNMSRFIIEHGLMVKIASLP